MPDTDSNNFNVDLNNYQGPLDILLDLAKAQKVNLEDISITKLADQFYEFITSEKNLNLEIASEYLVMATWLTYLKSKLLLPGDPEEEFKVLEVAVKLKLQDASIEDKIVVDRMNTLNDIEIKYADEKKARDKAVTDNGIAEDKKLFDAKMQNIEASLKLAQTAGDAIAFMADTNISAQLKKVKKGSKEEEALLK